MTIALAALCIGEFAGAQSRPDFELPPINYSTTAPSNALTTLQMQLDSGAVKLPRGNDRQLLQALLKEMGISVESQVLVFSKTSFQRKLISPDRPRALYFSDDCYLGWVPGGLMEATATDPKLGLAFYRFDPQVESAPFQFSRDDECLSCHAGSMTRQWPGLMVRSVSPGAEGEPILAAGTILVGHETPLADRWGGWYVTGKHGDSTHMGNVIAREVANGATLDRKAGANLTHLEKFFPAERYPHAESDIVALMVLEHQVNMHNRLAQGALRARKWIAYQHEFQKLLGEPLKTGEITGTGRRVVDAEAQSIVEYMLFCDEIKLPVEGIRGAGRFEPAFRQTRRTDSKGRSLKDFDLRTRLFAYRCSYMIYSQAFDALPPELKAEVYRRLFEILTAAEPPSKFKHLESDERRAIREILVATKTDLPASWRMAQ